jgi:hypothetical protein
MHKLDCAQVANQTLFCLENNGALHHTIFQQVVGTLKNYNTKEI